MYRAPRFFLWNVLANSKSSCEANSMYASPSGLELLVARVIKWTPFSPCNILHPSKKSQISRMVVFHGKPLIRIIFAVLSSLPLSCSSSLTLVLSNDSTISVSPETKSRHSNVNKDNAFARFTIHAYIHTTQHNTILHSEAKDVWREKTTIQAYIFQLPMQQILCVINWMFYVKFNHLNAIYSQTLCIGRLTGVISMVITLNWAICQLPGWFIDFMHTKQ